MSGTLPISVGVQMNRVPVLFTQESGVYHDHPLADPWPASRDARTYDGSFASVNHPPCRGWGRLRAFAKIRPDELDLARFSVDVIRRNGGILEHPASSLLWRDQGLPAAGRFDSFGGFTVAMPQFWFGHRAWKASWFYVCGCLPGQLPEIPFAIGEPDFCVGFRRDRPGFGSKTEIPKSEREKTPPLLADWLIRTALVIESRKGGAGV